MFFHLVKDLKQRNKFWANIQIPCNSLCCSTRVFVCFYLLLKLSIPQHLDQWHRLEPANKVETTATPDLLWQAQNYATHQHSKSSVDAMERWQSNVQCTNLQRHQDKQPWRTFQIHSLELVLCKRGELDVLKRRRVTGTWSKQRKIICVWIFSWELQPQMLVRKLILYCLSFQYSVKFKYIKSVSVQRFFSFDLLHYMEQRWWKSVVRNIWWSYPKH